MKTFKLHGDTAYWQKGLSFNALNLNTLENDITSPIPEDKRVYVTLVSNVYRVKGTHDEVLKGEISESDKNAILTEIRQNTPDFILSLGGKVVGYANYKLRDGAVKPATTDTAKKYVDAALIVTSNLELTPEIKLAAGIQQSVTDEDIATLAQLANLRKKFSCKNGIERIAIIDYAIHTLYIEDIPIKVLEEEYNGKEEEYIKNNYTFMGKWEWDYITDIEYTPNGGETYSIEPSDFVD